MMISLMACIAGFLLDFLFGDPVWLYHPVRVIGNFISFGEKTLRRLFPKTPGGELAAGTVLWFLTAGAFFFDPFCGAFGSSDDTPCAAVFG